MTKKNLYHLINQYLFSLIFVLSTLNAIAQIPEPVLANVHYKYSHQYDTTNVNMVRKENFILLLGKSSWIYKSYDRMLQDSVMLSDFRKTGQLTPPSSSRKYAEELFFFVNPSKSFFRNKTIGNYIVEVPNDVINWKITKETKKIENLFCQKAETSFHGRDYIAWFTTSLPFKAGPWKLQGLPGLIVTAYDKTGRIRFDFDGFARMDGKVKQTGWEKNSKQITKQEYDNILKAIQSDPNGYVEKRFNIKITSGQMLHRNLSAPNPLVNFPLEVN